ncbi:oxysterol binding protein [Ceratobasidium sp. AG-Ba]|nr:oxysterol binding protein [Ceratobasidium sp. AG-Ba]QRW05387.1 oxysterol binding protein [Ceratobasidium sp. AG-Ba]
MGLLSGLQGGANNVRKRVSGANEQDGAPEGSAPDDTSVLDENEGSIVMSIISQLRIGMDLQRVAFPTFVLEPRSMLERITDFMSHPDLIFGAENDPSPEERFVRVLRYYLSGWHIKPKGVKKPYNPVLGEFFRCRYDYPNGTQAFYIAEQVSHHPPISAYFYISPANKVRIVGELRPKSKFLGNSVMTVMEGENRVLLMGKPEDGEYVISMPNMYARGILFGRMVLELGDMCAVKCEQTNMVCDVEFKTKGFFSGAYNAVVGKVKRSGAEIAEVSGFWSSAMEYKSSKTGEKRVLFDAAKENIVEKFVFPEEEQEPNESQRLWTKLTDAIHHKDMDAATDAKAEVENAQREAARKREESGAKHVPRFFEVNKQGQWVPKILSGNGIPSDPDAAVQLVQSWIWPPKNAAPVTSSQPATSSQPTTSSQPVSPRSKAVPPEPGTSRAPGAVSSTSA